MEKSVTESANSYLLALAAGMAPLIDEWRAEISAKKDLRPKLNPQDVANFLRKIEECGIPALQIVIVMMACEWAFRVRLATDADIENALCAMESGFCKPFEPVLTPYQAQLVIRALEPSLRRQMKKTWIPIVLGFGTNSRHPNWEFFGSSRAQGVRKAQPASAIDKRRGRPPLLGAIVAGLIVEAIAKEHMPRGSAAVAKKLYRLLLRRAVQGSELKKWRTRLEATPYGTVSLRIWMRDRMIQAHHQSFEMPGEAMSAERFLSQCKTDPHSVLWWFAQEDILKQIYSLKWG